MEHIKQGQYKPILKNEVLVEKRNLNSIFSKGNVYVFGYGSLLVSEGWNVRGMQHPPGRKDLIECVLNGFERGPFGIYGYDNFYGIIRHAQKSVTGVLVPIASLRDWVNLMYTEYIAGLVSHVNYRVIDVTKDISDIRGKLAGPCIIHTVCNRPINRTKCLYTYPAKNYYDSVWKLVRKSRSKEFIDKFLKTGGFRGNWEVEGKLNNHIQF